MYATFEKICMKLANCDILHFRVRYMYCKKLCDSFISDDGVLRMSYPNTNGRSFVLFPAFDYPIFCDVRDHQLTI